MVAIITLEQRGLLVNEFIEPLTKFNLEVIDINGNYCIGEEEISKCNIQWLKELPLIEYQSKINTAIETVKIQNISVDYSLLEFKTTTNNKIYTLSYYQELSELKVLFESYFNTSVNKAEALFSGDGILSHQYIKINDSEEVNIQLIKDNDVEFFNNLIKILSTIKLQILNTLSKN